MVGHRGVLPLAPFPVPLSFSPLSLRPILAREPVRRLASLSLAHSGVYIFGDLESGLIGADTQDEVKLS